MFLAHRDFVILVNFQVIMVTLNIIVSNSDDEISCIVTTNSVSSSKNVPRSDEHTGCLVLVVSVQNCHDPRVLSKGHFVLRQSMSVNRRLNSTSTRIIRLTVL